MSDWDPLLEDLALRRAAATAMGGEERLERHRDAGRLDARARVARLLDPGTFVELGALVGSVSRGMSPPAPADGFIAGHGLIEGRSVLVGAEDFTVMGGSIGPGSSAKRVRLARLAAQEQAPLVMLLEGSGERAQDAYERHPHAPNDLQELTRLSGMVPTVAAVMGASAGHGALTAPLMDFTVMVEGAAMFSSGPPVVAATTGEEVGKEDLGGTAVHTVLSGVAHNAAPDDGAALDLVRQYLSYFPSSAWARPPRRDTGDGNRTLDRILELIPADPRQLYDMRPVLELLGDRESLLEIEPGHGRSIVTALVRIGGRPTAVVANQPAVEAGSIDSAAADKVAHFLEVADAFHLPVVFLADTPGVSGGTTAERTGVLRHVARMFAAQSRLRGPKLHVTLRKAFGLGSSLMAMNPFDEQTITLAFPGARIGAMPAESGAAAAHIETDVPTLMEHAELGGAYSSADAMSYDDVIDPRELRNHLLRALELAATRSEPVEPARRAGIRP